MCGIGGFSLAQGSKINPRKLSNALLTGLETRGSQASGFAWQADRRTGYYKQDIAGSRLSLRSMPRATTTAILHTRLATHGSTKNNANNHPVMSPDQNIALVHNGVIYNHKRVRQELPFQLPEVDTSVIPAILQKYGFERFDMLDGDASVAWLDQRKAGMLHVGRFSHSPLVIAQLTDGSFVFASTEAILTKALKQLRLEDDFRYTVPEGQLYTVVSGIITATDKLPITSPQYEEKLSTYNYGKYRSATSGNAHAFQPDYEAWDNYSYSSYGDGLDADYQLAMDKDVDRLQFEFEEFLGDYIEIDKFFYTYDGTLLGDIEYMSDLFESNRYRKYWERSADDYSDSYDSYPQVLESELF